MKTPGILAFVGFVALCADCEDMSLFLLSKLVGIVLILSACATFRICGRIKTHRQNLRYRY